jgi:P-type E1-E2 ATPase
MGLHIAMVTGDDHRTAAAVARQIGIDQVISEVLPAGKVDEVKRLHADGQTVAMVGDGINDARPSRPPMSASRSVPAPRSQSRLEMSP